jgi:hypothetical protein
MFLLFWDWGQGLRLGGRSRTQVRRGVVEKTHVVVVESPRSPSSEVQDLLSVLPGLPWFFPKIFWFEGGLMSWAVEKMGCV